MKGVKALENDPAPFDAETFPVPIDESNLDRACNVSLIDAARIDFTGDFAGRTRIRTPMTRSGDERPEPLNDAPDGAPGRTRTD